MNPQMNLPLLGLSRFINLLYIQAHWTKGIDHVVGEFNIPLELNSAFLASGYQMPVAELFMLQYSRAYEHWLQGGDPKETKDFVFQSDEVRQAYKRHMDIHGSKALLKAHFKRKESLNVQLLPVGRQSQCLMHA